MSETNKFNEFDGGEELKEIEDIIEDDNELDMIIEITEEEEVIIEITEEEEEVVEDVVLSKHKIQGKHSLKYDTIFKGKKEEISEEEDTSSTFFNDNFDLDKGSSTYLESHDSESYLRQKRVKERVYEVLLQKSGINFLNNRRKPSRIDFNHYFNLLNNELKSERFTNVEIFNELSFYFSDNLFNMFKLLDNKWRNKIISELQDHIGRGKPSKEITNRNIYEGTEVEFLHEDIMGEERFYTGVVIQTNYQDSIFKIDSYENIYEIHINKITKILNNTKFKHNLNKLNNIDFL